MLNIVKLLAFCMGLCAFGEGAIAAARETADRLRGHAAANTGGAGRLFTLAANVADEIADSLEMTAAISQSNRADFRDKRGPYSYDGAMMAEQTARQGLAHKLARLLWQVQQKAGGIFDGADDSDDNAWSKSGDVRIVIAPDTDTRRASPLDRLAERVKSIGDDLDMHKHNVGENNARIFEALDLQEVDNNPDRLFSGVIATVSAKVDDMGRSISDVAAALDIEMPEEDGEPARSLRFERAEQRADNIAATVTGIQGRVSSLESA